MTPASTLSRGGAGGAHGEGAVTPAASSSIMLPLPPTANHMWVHTGKQHFRSPQYVAWLTECGWRITSTRFPRFSGRFCVEIDLPAKMRGDIDNRSKCALDLLVRQGVVTDDRFCDRLIVSRAEDVPSKMCRITVTSINPEKET